MGRMLRTENILGILSRVIHNFASAATAASAGNYLRNGVLVNAGQAVHLIDTKLLLIVLAANTLAAGAHIHGFYGHGFV